MKQAESCDGCSQARDCKGVYQQLGHAEGPSVALKAVLAFALPIFTFLMALAVFGHLLHERLAERYQSPVAFVLSLLVTMSFILMASAVVKRLHRKQ